MHIMNVVGARPNFMKIAPIYREMKKNNKFNLQLVHTGQHYDEKMSKMFFEDLELPEPDIYLGVGSGTHAQQTAKIMLEFEKVLNKYHPDLVVVVGDVNSTIAHHAAHTRHDRGKIDVRDLSIDPQLLGLQDLHHTIGGKGEDLRGDAAHIQADAAKRLARLDQDDFLTQIGCPERSGISSRAATEDEDLGMALRGRDATHGLRGPGCARRRGVRAGVS